MTSTGNNVFNLAEIALEVARSDPGRIAVVEPDGRERSGKRRYKRYTYRELSNDAEAIALGLRDIGVAECTRTVFMAPPSYESCVLQLALSRVGATMLWIDPAVGYLNVGERLRRLDPEAFVGIPLAHLARTVFGWGPRVMRKAIVLGAPGFPFAHDFRSLRKAVPAHPTMPQVDADDPAAVLYTTGSTGPAKATLYPHRNFCEIVRIAHQSWNFQPGEVPVDMPAFPAFSFIALSAGGTVVVPPINFAFEGPADAKPDQIVEVINDCGVRSMFASPALLRNLGRYARQTGARTPSLKRVIGGGAPIVASIMEPLLEMMGEGAKVCANYGATEALPSTELEAAEALAETWPLTEQGHGICVGRPFEGVEIRIVAISDEPMSSIEDAHELPTGEIGEIVIHGGHVSPAYCRDEQNTRKHKIDDGEGGVWHRIGDAGYFDERGRLWYCGRVNQRVCTAGGAVYSLLAEPIFNTHPKVARSGLVGVRANGEELPVICIETVPGVRRSELPALREQLLALAARHEVTRQIGTLLFKDKLPVDPRHNSKIERPRLARWARGRITRPGAALPARKAELSATGHLG